MANCLFHSALLYQASGSDPVERDTAASIRHNSWWCIECGIQPWQNSVPRPTLTFGSMECHYYLSMTHTTNELHVVVFEQRLSAWGSCQDRIFRRFPENGPPFPRHDMAWHGTVVSCRIPLRSAGHPTLPDLVPLRITSPLQPRSASIPIPSALEATSVLHILLVYQWVVSVLPTVVPVPIVYR